MKLIIPFEIWQRMQCYVNLAAPAEITGFGTIKQIAGDFVVDDIFIPEQASNEAFCETVEGAVNDIILDLIENSPTRVGDLRFRWHSHANGPVFWSITDENDIVSWEGPWVVNLVTNVNGDAKARLDAFMDELNIVNVELEVCLNADIPSGMEQACTAEVRQKVKYLPPAKKPKKQGKYPANPKGGDRNVLDVARSILRSDSDLRPWQMELARTFNRGGRN